MISVVIPTRNRADLLAPALESIFKQNLVQSEFEVLVIDNGSTDHTLDAVKNWTNRLSNLRYFHEAPPGLHKGRHRGLLEAKGKILVFADDDIEAEPNWLQTIDDIFSDPDVAMAGGNNSPLFLQAPPPWLDYLWNSRNRDGSRVLASLSIQERPEGRYPISPYLVWGCNFAIRKEVLLAAGGFHPDGMPKELSRFRGDGETHVSRYVAEHGLKCLFDSGASVYHKVTPERMTYQYFRQRGYNQGVSDSYTALRNQDAQTLAVRRNLMRRTISWAWRQVKNLAYLNSDAKQALLEHKMGHSEGFAYHQQCYATDPEVRAWVHQPTYY